MIDALIQTGPGSTETAGVQVERLWAAITPLIRLRYPDGAVRVSDLEQLVLAARGAQDVRHFVSELVLDPPASSADLAGPPHLDEDYLVLSTVHSAKGLEWDAVHLIAAYDGNFPAYMSTGTGRGSPRSAACSTSRSPDHAAGFTYTCHLASTTVRAPATTRTAWAKHHAS